MNKQIVVLVGALVTFPHCGGESDLGSSGAGPHASSSSSGGGSGAGSGSGSGGVGSGSSSGSACPGLSTFDGGPRETPAVHRAQATACAPSSDHLACEVTDGGGQACVTDADCSGDGSFNPYSSCLRGQCSIDQCLSDSDCTSTQVCSCSSAYYGGNACYHPNLCVPANCQVDSDCGPGGFCSPSAGYCGTVEGYYCHKPRDPCLVPTDCGGTIPGAACVYTPEVGVFCCGQSVCAG